MRSKRFERIAERPINKDTFVKPWPEVGLGTTHSPFDPAPGLAIRDGAIVEMDGVASEDFDLVEMFIARHAIDLSVAERAMGTPSLDIARMIVDINVPRSEVLEIVGGCTPAKLVDIMNRMNVLEMMMGLAKMRARRTPANQAHVTNRKEHPALLAADAAEAALRGFAEIETTVAVARYAPFNALAILVGSQTGRGGVLTQCAVEEATNLRLGFKGLTSYSETLSVYAHRAGVRRRRRHAVVEGVPRRRLRQPRRQDALHVRRRRAGAHGPRRRQVDAVPRGAQPAGDAGSRKPGLAERLDQLHCAARVAAGRVAGRDSPRT